MSFIVYILECVDHTYYTGSTNNLDKRFKEHNTAKNGAHYTKIRRPVRLVYEEQFDNFALARAREGEIKRLTKREKESLVSSMVK